MAVERIEPNLCIGCGTCFDSCYADVIRMDKESGKAVARYPQDCVLCAWCIVGCPVNAIVFTPGRTSPVFTSWG
jgi:NAD-dependent dihydropyrimidine dehydrogenase PreA subunit